MTTEHQWEARTGPLAGWSCLACNAWEVNNLPTPPATEGCAGGPSLSEELADQTGIAPAPAEEEPEELEAPRQASIEELRKLVGLPENNEPLCGEPGPQGVRCRLREKHDGDLHAADGRSWVAGQLSWGEQPADVGEPAAGHPLDRIAAAFESIATDFAAMRRLAEHLVELQHHTVR